ncbi:hypothetical protein [Microbacterium aurantiacum]|uniref:hypothetical protein n=1 Tax=Microbacterium aurantiacum TaxID=162393 RepID=UPI000A8ABB73|nr:hypothetical protein [Microbacterium chocolatum]
MEPKKRGRLVIVSALTALVGAIVTMVYVFQPWRSCDYEDTSAGCAMLPTDAFAMTLAAVATIIAAGVFAYALLAKEHRPAS